MATTSSSTISSKSPGKMEPNKEQKGAATNKLQLGEIAIEASEIVSRLEQVAAETGTAAANETTAKSPSSLFPNKPNELDNIGQIIQSIQTLITTDEDGDVCLLPDLDSVARLVIASQAISSYCSTLDRAVSQKLSTHFTIDTARWLSHLFGFLDASVFYHEDQLEGLVRITRMMLHYKYPRYLEDGALVFTMALPTIYTSIASPLVVVQHLCRQLGLPLSCVRPVPVNTHFGSQFTMDLSILQKMLLEDVNAGRKPLIVIADAGTPVTGHLDNIPRLQEICKSYDVWLHLRGNSLAALALPLQRSTIQNPIADSFTLSLGNWLSLPALPMITLYRVWDKSNKSDGPLRPVGTTRESTLPLIAGLTNDHQGRRLISLPLWVAMQALGKEGVHARIRDNFLVTERLWAALDCFKQIRILSQKPGGESGTYTVSELVSKPSTIPILFETTACSVVFQFTPETTSEVPQKVPLYYDNLNSWLGQILQIDAPQVPISICELESIGIVLRFCPFEYINCQRITLDDVYTFAQCLEQQVIILNATIPHRETFVKLIEASPVLRHVELPEWAGLGGVRYAPEGWEELLTDQAKEELNNLNMALVDALRSTDSAFSLGESVDGLFCVRFGMLTPQSDVEELISLVIRVGQSVEENSKVLDSMSEIVKKGIETATLDLQKENEEKLWQEGILRQVPVVGTFMNWWAPKQKETGVRGRSLNLTQGVVESTENIYKYHMQMQGGTPQSGVKSPPTPQVQTPVGAGSHSRSSSHASSQGSAQQMNNNNVQQGGASNLASGKKPLNEASNSGGGIIITSSNNKSNDASIGTTTTATTNSQ